VQQSLLVQGAENEAHLTRSLWLQAPTQSPIRAAQR